MVPSSSNPDYHMEQHNVFTFLPWFGSGKLEECSFEIGSFSYGPDGAFKLELLASSVKGELALIFEAPLAIRIVQEGSLMDYWNNGFVVRGHNVFVTLSSQFLSWLEHSSSGVHSVGCVKHFGVFTDDVCVEVLSINEPVVYTN